MASITEITSSLLESYHHSSSADQSSAPWMKYDVFLSFRGADTRRTIVSSLYYDLVDRGIKTFMDDTGLETGSHISPSLMTAINESLLAIVVLSPDYASSHWCLHELSMIIQCMEERNMIVIPIFYCVKPSDLRAQKFAEGRNIAARMMKQWSAALANQKSRFMKALSSHEKRFDQKTVNQWRASLAKVADLSGLESSKYGSDRHLVKGIVDIVCGKLQTIDIDWGMYTGGFVASEATKLVMDKVTRALQQHNLEIIGVHGMGGVGKTSMVQHVAAHVQKAGLFNRVIMSAVSQTPNLKNIQDTLADQLGLKLVEVTNDDVRARRIMKAILGEYEILIILDDIWERIELFKLGIPNHDDLQRRGSKIMFTTRNLNVCHTMESKCHTMESKMIILLKPLSKEDAWELFVKKVGKSFHKSSEIYEVAKAVANECAGLPVAIVAVARALGDKDLDDWIEAVRRLKASQPAHFEDGREVFRCIKLSYDFLRSDDDNIAKVFFLLCCLFPEDSDIEVEDLLVYALGKGLFKDTDTIKVARARAYSVIKYLKSSSLLLDSAHYGCVKMHDVVRDVAISISLSEEGSRFLVKAGCGLKDWPANITDEGYTAISLMRNEMKKLPNTLVCPKLQILLLQCNVLTEIPDPLFRSSDDLRILDVSESNISTLPSSLALLTRLQALYLDDCKREVDISILGKLKSLEILSMRKINILHGGVDEKIPLPEEIGELNNLKILDVTHACFQTVPSMVLSKLKEIEELHIKCDFSNWGSYWHRTRSDSTSVVDKAASFDELIGLSRLNNLKVQISDVWCLPPVVESNPNWFNFDICFSSKEYLERSYYGRFFERKHEAKMDTRRHLSRYLTLNTSVKYLPDWFLDVVTEKTEILEYTGCRELADICDEYHHGRLHSVKYLGVIDCRVRSTLMYTCSFPNIPVFERLEELYLEGVSVMRMLCDGELAPGSLSKLKLLNVRNCLELSGVLLDSSLCNRLQNLEILHYENTEMRSSAHIRLKYVFHFGMPVSEQILFPELRGITVCNLPDLELLCYGHPRSGSFHNLKSLVIRDCGRLIHLFDYEVARLLSQLDLLWVENCSGLETIIEGNSNGTYEVVFPKLKDVCLNGLPKLKRIYSRGVVQCPSLEHLYVCMCPNFQKFLMPSHVKHNDEEHFAIIFERLFHRQFIPEAVPQFFSKKKRDFSTGSWGVNSEWEIDRKITGPYLGRDQLRPGCSKIRHDKEKTDQTVSLWSDLRSKWTRPF